MVKEDKTSHRIVTPVKKVDKYFIVPESSGTIPIVENMSGERGDSSSTKEIQREVKFHMTPLLK